jgi:dephospho-CoA kinase
VHLPLDGQPNQRFALLFVDWLGASPAARADFVALKRAADPDAVLRWFRDAHHRAEAWAGDTGWSVPPVR